MSSPLNGKTMSFFFLVLSFYYMLLFLFSMLLCLCLLYNRGKDIEGHEMLRQGFTHAFLMTFNEKEALNAFQVHPNHVEFSKIFSPALEKIVVMDFPAITVKAPT